VQQVGERLAAKSHRPDLIYRFTVLDSPDVNAFALPGGYIYITRGIMAYFNSEAELAGVLGHEIGHVTARHSVRQISAAQAGSILASIFIDTQAGAQLFNVLGTALLSGYGRDHELEADRLGAEYLARTDYDSDAMLEVIGILKNQEELDKERAKAEGREPRSYHGVFASHPRNDQRLQEVVGAAKKLKTSATERVGRDEYLKHIDGMIYGDSAKHGVRHGSSFYHADMNFALDFPKGWRLENSPQAVTAHAPGNDVLLELRSQDLNKRVSPEVFLKNYLQMDVKNGASIPGLALPSHSGIVTLKTPFGQRPTRVSAVFHDNRAFVFFGAGKDDNAFKKADDDFLKTARSLRALKADERRIAAGLKLKVVRAAPGDTFAKLAKRSPISSYAESSLRVLNDKYPTGEPKAGESIKIVQ
jgi:predicted Zn-dependent protease